MSCRPAISVDTVEMAARDQQCEPRDFLRPNRLGQRDTRNFQRIGNVLRQAVQDSTDVDAAFTGKLPLVARGADDAVHRRRNFPGGVADVCEAEPLAGQLRELVDARVGAPEMEHVDEDARVVPVHSSHDPGRGGEVAGLGPMRKLQAHEDAERLREIAQPGETLGRTLAIRIRQLRDDVLRAQFGGRFELGNEVVRPELRFHAE